MSSNRKIWNDGEGVSTPELQRSCDVAASADDRAYEVLLTPGSVQKKVLPLSDETQSGSAQVPGGALNPRYMCVPSQAGLTPAGTAGGVRILPAAYVAGLASNTQQVSLQGSTFATSDTTAITSNSSGGIRYDLVYATLTRQVSVTGARKIKSVVDGSITSQTINLADTPTLTFAINPGFLTGATPPTTAQITAALPSDTTTSFSFPLCYVQVANGYSSGTNLFQNSSGGSTFIVQAWPGGFIPTHRVRGFRPASIYASALAVKPSTPLTDRWGAVSSFVVGFKHTASNQATNVLDNSINWNNRMLWGYLARVPNNTSPKYPAPELNTIAGAGINIAVGPVFTVSGGQFYQASFNNDVGTLTIQFTTDSNGQMSFTTGNSIAPSDGGNGDNYTFIVYATDRYVF